MYVDSHSLGQLALASKRTASNVNAKVIKGYIYIFNMSIKLADQIGPILCQYILASQAEMPTKNYLYQSHLTIALRHSERRITC